MARKGSGNILDRAMDNVAQTVQTMMDRMETDRTPTPADKSRQIQDRISKRLSTPKGNERW